MTDLFVTTPGTLIRKADRSLVVVTGDQTKTRLPVTSIERLLLFGPVQVTSQAVQLLLEAGVEVAYLSRRGELRGTLAPVRTPNVYQRLAQFERFKTPAFRLEFARAIVAAKIANQREVLRLWASNHGDEALTTAQHSARELLGRVPGATDPSELLGFEGAASAAYFGALRDVFGAATGFPGRVRRPPKDPVNALLSLCYVMLGHETAAFAEAVSLDPHIGFLHGLRYGRQSLGLDLIEPFRQPLVDRFVFRLFHLGQVAPDGFRTEADGAVRLTEEGAQTFFPLWAERMRESVRRGGTTSWRQALRRDVRRAARAILRGEAFEPFRLDAYEDPADAEDADTAPPDIEV